MSLKVLKSVRLSLQEAATDRHFSSTISWIHDFLDAPHASLGRPGDVCPFIGAALSRNSIELFKNNSSDVSSFEADIQAHLVDFEAGSRSDLYRSRLILPTSLENANIAVETVQRRLKPMVVERNLMIGQFYPDCSDPGLWNKDFRPLRAPVPLLALRNMVPTDIAFLHHNPSFVKFYLDHFGSRGLSTLRQFEAIEERASD